MIRRIIALAKAEKLTSVADFIAARYGKNPMVAAIVALISLVGAIPYIALQLKAVSSSVSALVDTSGYGIGSGQDFIDLPLLVTLFLACFAIVFGTRHTDATEHQDGLILAIAMESVVKLLALVTAGIYVVFFLFDGPSDLWAKALANQQVMTALHYQTPLPRWILLVVLSAFAIIMLPRQFHVTVVENRTEKDLRTAGILFPIYLVAINLFVLPRRDCRRADLRRHRRCRSLPADAAAGGRYSGAHHDHLHRRIFRSDGHGHRRIGRAVDHDFQRHHHAGIPAAQP